MKIGRCWRNLRNQLIVAFDLQQLVCGNSTQFVVIRSLSSWSEARARRRMKQRAIKRRKRQRSLARDLRFTNATNLLRKHSVNDLSAGNVSHLHWNPHARAGFRISPTSRETGKHHGGIICAQATRKLEYCLCEGARSYLDARGCACMVMHSQADLCSVNDERVPY